MADSVLTIVERRLRRVLRGRPRAAPASLPPTPADPNFEWAVYRTAHADLGGLPDEAAGRVHFYGFGRHEGRVATAADLKARLDALQAAHGPLPDDFVWTDYRANYPDLKRLVSADTVAAHFLRHGAPEGRLHERFDPDLYRSLTFPGSTMSPAALMAHYRETGRAAGLPTSLESLARQAGIEAWTWLGHLDVPLFDLLNRWWAGPVTTLREALDAMIREGFDRLAPIGLSLLFDHAYFVEANPGAAALTPGTAYRQWLFNEVPGGRPGSAADHLSRHGIALGRFPAGFDWERYRRMPGVYGDSRWALLDHVVANGTLAAEDIPVQGEEAGAFLAALATTMTGRIAARGAALFVQAARHAPLAPTDEACWGDALARQGLWAEALDHYRTALAGEGVGVAIPVAAVRVALDAGEPRTALGFLERSREAAGGDMRWRTALEKAIAALFAEAWRAAEALYAAERRTEADAVLTAVVADIERWWTTLDPLGLPLPSEVPRRVVLLANVDLRQCTHYRVEQKAEIFAAAGIALAVFPQDEVEAFMTALPGAAAAIFYRLPAMPANVRARRQRSSRRASPGRPSRAAIRTWCESASTSRSRWDPATR